MSDFEVPEEALTESFLAASGPGGQNVNKVATACQLRCNVFALGLAPDVYTRLKTLAGSRMTGGGEIVITARKYRTQEGNREEARNRLAELVAPPNGQVVISLTLSEQPPDLANTRLTYVLGGVQDELVLRGERLV